MKYIGFFLLIFGLFYLLYFITVLARKKRIDRFRNSSQVHLLVKRYQLDLQKLDLYRLAKILAFSNSFILAVVVMTTFLVDNFILQLFIAFLFLIPALLIAYHFIGRHLQKEEQKHV